MLPYLADRFADPLGNHAASRAVAEGLEDARARLAAAIGAAADEVVWTSGATESSNLALRGVVEPLLRAGERPHVVVSAVEHAAVLGPARHLTRLGAELTVVPVDPQGLIDPAAVEAAIRPATRLVSVVHANDEVGAIQPVAAVAAVCRRRGVMLHSDAAQTLAKIPVDVRELDVDLLSLSSHKAYGPKGVGALYVRRGVGLEPLMWGDGHEAGQRAGMPNVAGIVGFGAVAALAAHCVEDSSRRIATLRDRLEGRLLDGAPDAAVFGPRDGRRLPGTLCLALPGVVATDLMAAVPELCAMPCAGGTLPDELSLSTTLRALGADPQRAAGAVRLSLGWYSDEEEIDAAADALLEAWDRLRWSSPGRLRQP